MKFYPIGVGLETKIIFVMFHCQAKTEKQRPASPLLLAHHTTGKDMWSFCARRPAK